MKNKVNYKMVVLGSAACLIPCLIGLALWNKLPETVPFHWNVKGEVDRYASKAVAIFVLPVCMAAFNALLHFLSSFEKRRENYSKALTSMLYWFLPVLTLVISSLSYAVALGKKVNVEVVLPVLIGVMLIFIGNYLPKCKQNSTMGIRLPWTLKSEENWNRTHHMAGFLWIVCGVAVTASAFLQNIYVMLAIVFVSVIVPTVYSFVLHKKGI